MATQDHSVEVKFSYEVVCIEIGGLLHQTVEA